MFLILPLWEDTFSILSQARRVYSHRDSWKLRSMEGAQDGGEKAPPCLLTAAGPLACHFPSHKNPVGTRACWDSAHQSEADGLRPSLICWWH
jgi:hypothetical protein